MFERRIISVPMTLKEFNHASVVDRDRLKYLKLKFSSIDLGLGFSSWTLCRKGTARLFLCEVAGVGVSVEGVGSVFPLLTRDTEVLLARMISMIMVLQSQHILI